MLIKEITLPRNLLQVSQATLPDQQITVLLGPNGSGKSTLLAYLATHLPECAYLPQQNQSYDALSVDDLLALGQQRATSPLTIDIVAELELAPLLAKQVNQLSGGQQQRVWIAFILLQNAPVILLDEPLNGLDLRYQQRLLQLLPQLKTTILMVVHDLNYAYRIADWIWLVSAATLNEGQPSNIMTTTDLTATFATPVSLHHTVDGAVVFWI